MRSVIFAGKMRERITIEKAVEHVGTSGETTLTWEPVVTVWASVDGVNASEVLGSGQLLIEVTHRVRLRYYEGLTQKNRFKWRGRTLDIISLLEHGDRSQHEAICLEDVTKR